MGLMWTQYGPNVDPVWAEYFKIQIPKSIIVRISKEKGSYSPKGPLLWFPGKWERGGGGGG